MTIQQAITRLRWLMLTLEEVRMDLALDIEALNVIERAVLPGGESKVIDALTDGKEEGK